MQILQMTCINDEHQSNTARRHALVLPMHKTLSSRPPFTFRTLSCCGADLCRLWGEAKLRGSCSAENDEL